MANGSKVQEWKSARLSAACVPWGLRYCQPMARPKQEARRRGALARGVAAGIVDLGLPFATLVTSR